MTCRQLAKELAGDKWTLGELAGLSVKNFWTWAKMDTTGYDGHVYLARKKCVKFERELCFDLGKCMWRKHRSIYHNHMKYIHNDIVKTFKVKILCYAERVRDMHDLAKYHPTPSMKGKSADAANLTVRNQEFTDSELRLAIKDRLPSSMQDELEDHPEDY